MVKKILQYSLIVILSTIAGLYLFIIFQKGKEILIFKYKKDTFFLENKKPFDDREKKEVYLDLKKTYPKIKPYVQPFDHENKFHTLSGISNSKTIMCNDNGYYSIYDSDRYGFNNPDSEWDNLIADTILIGDSATQGACVNRPFDIASVLRSLSKKTHLNLGNGGNGFLRNYATLKEFYKDKTKSVLFFYYEGNDNFNFENELKNKILVKYLKDEKFSQNLKNKQNYVDKIALDRIDIAISEVRFGKIENINFSFIAPLKNVIINSIINPINNKLTNNNESFNKLYSEIYDIIKLTKNFCDLNNSELYFVYLPDYYRYKNKNYSNQNYNKIKEIVKTQNINFIDIHKLIIDEKINPMKFFPFALNGHYTIYGYNKIANHIYRILDEKK